MYGFVVGWVNKATGCVLMAQRLYWSSNLTKLYGIRLFRGAANPRVCAQSPKHNPRTKPRNRCVDCVLC